VPQGIAASGARVEILIVTSRPNLTPEIARAGCCPRVRCRNAPRRAYIDAIPHSASSHHGDAAALILPARQPTRRAFRRRLICHWARFSGLDRRPRPAALHRYCRHAGHLTFILTHVRIRFLRPSLRLRASSAPPACTHGLAFAGWNTRSENGAESVHNGAQDHLGPRSLSSMIPEGS